MKNRIVNHGVKPAAEFTLNPLNWRKHPKSQVNALRAVLSEVGWVQDVIVNEQTGHVIDGHARIDLALQNGSSVPYISVNLSAEEENLILATLDPVGALAGADADQLAALLVDIKTSDAALQAMLTDLAKNAGVSYDNPSEVDAEPHMDQISELQAHWNTQPGQLWQLGEHRLLCGDCTDAAAVNRLMAGERAVLFATDPPYLVDYDGLQHPGGKKASQNKNKGWAVVYGNLWDETSNNFGLFDRFIEVARAEAIQDNAAWYCWYAQANQPQLELAWIKQGALVHQYIIWVKNIPVLNRSWYMWQHEPCLMGWLKGHKPKRAGKLGLRSVWFEDDAVLAEGARREIAVDSALYTIDESMEIREPESTVWRIAHPGFNRKNNLHPTMKPVKIFEIPIQQHTVPGDLCYEPFCGSGTQLIAAERLGRRCRAVEINPGFVAVALQRYLDTTGRQPILL